MKILIFLFLIFFSCSRINQKSVEPKLSQQQDIGNKNKAIEIVEKRKFKLIFEDCEGKSLSGGFFCLYEVTKNAKLIRVLLNNIVLENGFVEIEAFPKYYTIGFLSKSGFEQWVSHNYNFSNGDNLIRIEKSGIIECSIISIANNKENSYVVPFYYENGVTAGGIGLLISGDGIHQFELKGLKKGRYYIEIKKEYSAKEIYFKSDMIDVVPGRRILLNNIKIAN